jgi:hypothetical protein
MQYTDEMHYALLNNPEGISLERLNLMVSGMESSNWHSAATPGRNATGFGGTPTYENSQKNTIGISNNEWERTPEIFSPDNDGFEDYLQLNYQLAQAGYTANILIYNAKGQKVLNLRNNIFLETQGQITWDGTDDDGNKANMGIYVIYIEMFNLNGDVEHFKLSCVLGGKL